MLPLAASEIRAKMRGERETFVAELRATADADAQGKHLRLSGHAAVFDSASEPIAGLFVERLRRGAFRRALAANPTVPLLVNHAGLPLASTANGTLTLSEEPRGLAFHADLADTQLGRDVHTLIERGDVASMSFAFKVADGGDEWRQGLEFEERLITEVGALYEISVVTFPAYPAAGVQARSAQLVRPVDAARRLTAVLAGEGVS